jgi:hypothetical protein
LEKLVADLTMPLNPLANAETSFGPWLFGRTRTVIAATVRARVKMSTILLMTRSPYAMVAIAPVTGLFSVPVPVLEVAVAAELAVVDPVATANPWNTVDPYPMNRLRVTRPAIPAATFATESFSKLTADRIPNVPRIPSTLSGVGSAWSAYKWAIADPTRQIDISAAMT